MIIDSTGGTAGVLRFDRLTPSEKYQALTSDPAAGCPGGRAHGDLLLLGLLAFADASQEFSGSATQYYLLYDDTLAAILDLAGLHPGACFGRDLVALTLSQMAYRFTVAKKFQADDPAGKQLRINSWGREHVREHVLPRERAAYALVRERLRETFDAEGERYTRLFSLLSSPHLEPHAAEIRAHNAALTVKVVA